MGDLGQSMSQALSGFGGFLRCETCHHREPLGDPGRRVMGGGWPKCCGYTMWWWTQRQIDAGEVPGVADSTEVRLRGSVMGEIEGYQPCTWFGVRNGEIVSGAMSDTPSEDRSARDFVSVSGITIGWVPQDIPIVLGDPPPAEFNIEPQTAEVSG